MRGIKTDRAASIVIRGRAFIQNIRRGHYDLGVERDTISSRHRVVNELVTAI